MRNYKNKGVHSSPKNAGRQNLEKILDTLPKDESGLNKKILPVYKHGHQYKGQWTDEELESTLQEFFDYCGEVDLKPTQPLLRLWLGLSRAQMFDWRTKPEKYGVKSDMVNEAHDFMECYLQGNIDKYPTGSIFLLKSSYGHREATDVTITTQQTNPEDVADMVKNLGLDK